MFLWELCQGDGSVLKHTRTALHTEDMAHKPNVNPDIFIGISLLKRNLWLVECLGKFTLTCRSRPDIKVQGHC